jgi:hypothetical protein
LRLRDYSSLAAGMTFLGKQAKKCPHCGEIGLLEVENGKEFYVHSETMGFDESGSFVVRWSQCPKI